MEKSSKKVPGMSERNKKLIEVDLGKPEPGNNSVKKLIIMILSQSCRYKHSRREVTRKGMA